MLLFGSLLFTACDKDDDHDHLDQELITTVVMTFTETGGGSSTFKVVDLDGDGGNPPVVEEIKLKANTEYTVSVKFLDESNPADVEDITKEVLEEADEHLVCFTATGAMIAPTITDADEDGKPLGLQSTLTTGDAGTGSLRVVLKHEPNKSASNPCATGETDVDVTFPVKIE